MSGSSCQAIRPALGVYVLGAIDPGERAEVDEHLAGCAACREELAGLAGLPALLHRIPLSEAERLAAGNQDPDPAAGDPGDLLLRRLLARVAAARRDRWRRGLVAAAALVLLALGGGVAAGLLAGQPATPPVAVPSASASPGTVGAWHTVAGANPRTGVTLTVRYAPTSWGTSMSVQAAGVRPGTVCRFQVTDATGRRWTVGGWRVTYRGAATWYPASTWLPDGGLRSFELLAGQTVLASVAAG